MQTVKVFIENEKGSTSKNIYDEKNLQYKKTVIVSREYPYPYGFILNTTSEDGDNIDCFVITDRNLRTGEIIECEVIGLMEQRETSRDLARMNAEEEDHNVLAKIESEDVTINDDIKANLTEFISHVFDHIPNKKVKAGKFLDREAAITYIEKSRDV